MTVDFNGIGNNPVNNPGPQADRSQGNQKTPQPAADQARSQAPAARGENVNLSAQAKELKQFEQRLEDYPEVDDARVEQIRAALADGNYKIDAEKVAQKMLDMDDSIFG